MRRRKKLRLKKKVALIKKCKHLNGFHGFKKLDDGSAIRICNSCGARIAQMSNLKHDEPIVPIRKTKYVKKEKEVVANLF